MFTGLIEAVAKVVSIIPQGGGVRLGVDIAGLKRTPEIGASIAICGACQTVVELDGTVAYFDAVAETVQRTKLGALHAGDSVNLEASVRVGDPLDGHIVLGHVDATGKLHEVRPVGASRIYRFSLPQIIRHLVAEKGSIAIDGISLTVAEVWHDSFSVSVIPHTLNHTTLCDLLPGNMVNLEADVLARYAARSQTADAGGLSSDLLRNAGFF